MTLQAKYIMFDIVLQRLAGARIIMTNNRRDVLIFDETCKRNKTDFKQNKNTARIIMDIKLSVVKFPALPIC